MQQKKKVYITKKKTRPEQNYRKFNLTSMAKQLFASFYYDLFISGTSSFKLSF